MTDLAEHCEQDSIFSLPIILLASYALVLKVALVLCWVKYRNILGEVKLSSHVDGYVDCMVDTYFYGYLKKIIPDNGTGGLYKKIMNYKDKQNISDEEFPFHKIFILISASGYIPATLEEIDPERIEARTNLDPLELNRAGTKGRVYSTSVYKIRHRNSKKHITVAMEGAPPLLTLRDSCKENPELKSQMRHIILMFYKKLSQKLKENEEFANSYELLLYQDDPEKPTLADKIILKHVDGRWESDEAS